MFLLLVIVHFAFLLLPVGLCVKLLRELKPQHGGDQGKALTAFQTGSLQAFAFYIQLDRRLSRSTADHQTTNVYQFTCAIHRNNV